MNRRPWILSKKGEICALGKIWRLAPKGAEMQRWKNWEKYWNQVHPLFFLRRQTQSINCSLTLPDILSADSSDVRTGDRTWGRLPPGLLKLVFLLLLLLVLLFPLTLASAVSCLCFWNGNGDHNKRNMALNFGHIVCLLSVHIINSNKFLKFLFGLSFKKERGSQKKGNTCL